MYSARNERDFLFSRGGSEKLEEEVVFLVTQLAELEQKNLRSPILLQKPGGYFERRKNGRS